MITSIDHIGISSQDIQRDIVLLESMGYSLIFHQKDAPNPPEKASVLINRNPQHDLALLMSPKGIGIELLDHGAISWENASPMSLLVSGVDGLGWDVHGEVPICGENYAETTFPDMPCDAICVSDGDGFICHGVCIRVFDIRASIEFWTWFGCKVVAADDVSAQLRFTEFLTKKEWSVFLLVDKTGAANQYMDGSGINSVAFMSTSVIKDKVALTAKGYISTPIYQITINEKSLNILFVRGPSGENVEIISPASKCKHG